MPSQVGALRLARLRADSPHKSAPDCRYNQRLLKCRCPLIGSAINTPAHLGVLPAAGRCCPAVEFFLLGVFLVLFVLFVLRSFRRWLSAVSAVVLVACLPLLFLSVRVPFLVSVVGWSSAVCVLAWAFVGVVWCFSRLAFVRFPRPSSAPVAAWGVRRALLGSPCLLGWRCVPASSLVAVRSSCFVWGVSPAVVARRSGVVSFFWVWVVLPSPPSPAAAR